MKNKTILLGVIAVSVLMLGSVVFAMPKPVSDYADPKGKVNGPVGNSHVQHLYLVEKTGEPNWGIVSDGAWGKMTIKDDDSFVFNGHELTPETGYTLVRYAGTVWPVVVCMYSGTTGVDGNIHLSGYFKDYGDKVWLVLSEHVDCGAGVLTHWKSPCPAWLWEYALI